MVASSKELCGQNFAGADRSFNPKGWRANTVIVLDLRCEKRLVTLINLFKKAKISKLQ
jgi:hypothetical protein